MGSKNTHKWLERFIEIYRSKPCLWDTKSKEYYNRDLKSSAYAKLVEHLQIIDPSADKDSVVKKINNIRSAYKKERRKVTDSLKKGTKEIYRPKLWYYYMLLFLDEHEDPFQSSSNMDDDSSEDNAACSYILLHENISDSFDGIEEIKTEERSFLTAQSTSQSSPVAEATSQSPSATHSTSETRSIAKKSFNKSRIKRNLNEILTSENLQSVQNHFKRPVISNDRFDIFGANVAAKLRDLQQHQRILAEKLINETLFLAEMENLNILHQVTDSTSVSYDNYDQESRGKKRARE